VADCEERTLRLCSCQGCNFKELREMDVRQVVAKLEEALEIAK